MSNLSGTGTLRGVLGSEGGSSPQDVYWDDILDKPNFADVATSGSYNDLLDKPTIPPAPTIMTGATAQLNGVAGYAPQPLAGEQDKFLNGGGQWVTLPSSSVNYSTSEQVIGTWIDGKPIYRKTIYFPNGLLVQNNTWVSIGATASSLNIERFIKGFAMGSPTLAGGAGFNINVGIVNANISVYCDRNGDTIFIEYLTMEYTKTTDTIGG